MKPPEPEPEHSSEGGELQAEYARAPREAAKREQNAARASAFDAAEGAGAGNEEERGIAPDIALPCRGQGPLVGAGRLRAELKIALASSSFF